MTDNPPLMTSHSLSLNINFDKGRENMLLPTIIIHGADFNFLGFMSNNLEFFLVDICGQAIKFFYSIEHNEVGFSVGGSERKIIQGDILQLPFFDKILKIEGVGSKAYI